MTRESLAGDKFYLLFSSPVIRKRVPYILQSLLTPTNNFFIRLQIQLDFRMLLQRRITLTGGNPPFIETFFVLTITNRNYVSLFKFLCYFFICIFLVHWFRIWIQISIEQLLLSNELIIWIVLFKCYSIEMEMNMKDSKNLKQNIVLPRFSYVVIWFS